MGELECALYMAATCVCTLYNGITTVCRKRTSQLLHHLSGILPVLTLWLLSTNTFVIGQHIWMITILLFPWNQVLVSFCAVLVDTFDTIDERLLRLYLLNTFQHAKDYSQSHIIINRSGNSLQPSFSRNFPDLHSTYSCVRPLHFPDSLTLIQWRSKRAPQLECDFQSRIWKCNHLLKTIMWLKTSCCLLEPRTS